MLPIVLPIHSNREPDCLLVDKMCILINDNGWIITTPDFFRTKNLGILLISSLVFGDFYEPLFTHYDNFNGNNAAAVNP